MGGQEFCFPSTSAPRKLLGSVLPLHRQVPAFLYFVDQWKEHWATVVHVAMPV